MKIYIDDVGITKKEIQTLERWGIKKIKPCPEEGISEFYEIILIVHNPARKHDSGYPFIRAFAKKDDTLYDIGWHDAILMRYPVNIDAWGKNIFRLISKKKPAFFTRSDSFLSALWIDETGEVR